MTAPDVREQLLDVISFTECANQGTTPDALINAYRDQVLAKGDALIRGRCPLHSDAPATYMTCHCVAADQLLAARLNREA